jgi:hypothetical protein
MLILIGGPDGTGKTTIANLLETTLQESESAVLPVLRMHYRPNLMFKTHPSDANTDLAQHTEPHDLPDHGPLRSVAKVCATFLDTFFGQISARRGKTRHQVIIQERGWWDQCIDGRRYRLHPVGKSLARILARFVQRPDLVIVLTGPPEVIHQRKRELPVAEISRQLFSWTAWAPRIGKKHLLISVEETPQQGMQRILDTLELT